MPRSNPISLSPDEFRAAGHELVDAIADFLATLPDRRVTGGKSPVAIRGVIQADRPLPERGASATELLSSARDVLFSESLFNGHPRFFGYITSSPAPIGILGDLLASAVNPNVGAWQLSPVASEIEGQTIRWIAEMVGYPTACGGLLVSGGNVANFVGFLAARTAAAKWDVRKEGLTSSAARPLRVYASAETHTWIQKAADLFGLGGDAIRWIPTDDDLRMDTRQLRAAIARDVAAGDLPMMVVGTAGSVSTGAVDPLREIAEICREAGVWFHVDGAYGAFAVVAEQAPEDLRAMSLADSMALDPHKWLYAPLEAGCSLVRDPDALRNAFSYHPPYYHFGEEATNYVDFGLQNSRGFRALKVWLALQHVGREGYVRMISDDIRISERLATNVQAHADLEFFTQALSITTFRYVPGDMRDNAEYLNTLNQELLERLQRSGEAFVSNAVIDGRFALRACIVNYRTDEVDVDALPEIVVRLGRTVDAELRAKDGPNVARPG